MIGVAGLFLMPYLPFDHGFELRIVESGSMEPAIMTGAMIMVTPQETYEAGDVIMFSSRQTKVPTTHRIEEVYEENGDLWYITKGDANEERDAEVIAHSKIMGSVLFDVPRVGFVLDFARQPIGFILLIVLPALLIVLTEIEKIWREISSRRRPDNSSDDNDDTNGLEFGVDVTKEVMSQKVESIRSQQMIDIATPVHFKTIPTLDLRGMAPLQSKTTGRSSITQWMTPVSVVVFSVVVFSSGFLGTTVSYFNDTELSDLNFLSAIALDIGVVTDGSLFEFLGSTPDTDSVEVLVEPEAGSADAHYNVVTNVTAGSVPLCEAVVANASAPVGYVGSLPLLSASDIVFATPWTISFSIPDETGLLGGETCVAEVVLTAWHEDEVLGEGYYDEEIIPLVFTYTAPVPLAAAFDSAKAQPLTVLVEESESESGKQSSSGGGSSNSTKEVVEEGDSEGSEEGEIGEDNDESEEENTDNLEGNYVTDEDVEEDDEEEVEGDEQQEEEVENETEEESEGVVEDSEEEKGDAETGEQNEQIEEGEVEEEDGTEATQELEEVEKEEVEEAEEPETSE